MPGKKGVKLIPRKSTSGKYHSVKELVFALLEKNPTIAKDEVDKIVMKEYPKANFIGKDGKGGHFTWYKHKWNRMKLEGASFNLKEAHPKEEAVKEKKEEEVNEEHVSNESQEDNVQSIEGMDTVELGKSRNRGKNRRVPVQPNTRTMGVKTRKGVLQRKGNTKGTGRKSKIEVSH